MLGVADLWEKACPFDLDGALVQGLISLWNINGALVLDKYGAGQNLL